MEEIDIIINMSKEKKQRLKEYQNNYCDSEVLFYGFDSECYVFCHTLLKP